MSICYKETLTNPSIHFNGPCNFSCNLLILFTYTLNYNGLWKPGI